MSEFANLLSCWSADERAEMAVLLAHPLWQPASLAQIEALLSPADIVGYGGAAGGGKTDLMLGCALTMHRAAIVHRREAVQLKGIEDRSRDIIGGRGRYNGSAKVWRLAGGQKLEFGSMKGAGDWIKYQGRPYDFMGFDEAPHFLESQVRTLLGWNRTAVPGQRCRTILGFNPPTTPEGMWIIDFFGPWLDERHPNPAKPGELRWFAQIDGKEVEVADGAPFLHDGDLIHPKSRTFIPARVEDNPYLMETGYKAQLQALPEPLRSQMLRGDFAAGHDDDEWQVIPTAWVKAAQERWTPKPPGPMDALGVDVARGGQDNTVLTPRHGPWFGEQAVFPGSATPDGPAVAGLVVMRLKDGAPAQVDVIGVGSSVYDHLKGAHVAVVPYNGAAKSLARDRSGQLAFANLRAEMWWRMREALDPVHGDGLALPPGRQLLSDLCAPRWKMTAQGILIEGKEDIKKRIGRSPDHGDSAVLALPSNGKHSGGFGRDITYKPMGFA